ncbi:unnamed protein product [Owenia fusiformis]|uniref:Uncharacterized protein n=1 Tax=Owenia fusiformis TaxID=6347 RepID=A0A8J1TKM4_OWEFU|nr:unnamed protein product [Owenia fusiformis]
MNELNTSDDTSRNVTLSVYKRENESSDGSHHENVYKRENESSDGSHHENVYKRENESSDGSHHENVYKRENESSDGSHHENVYKRENESSDGSHHENVYKRENESSDGSHHENEQFIVENNCYEETDMKKVDREDDHESDNLGNVLMRSRVKHSPGHMSDNRKTLTNVKGNNVKCGNMDMNSNAKNGNLKTSIDIDVKSENVLESVENNNDRERKNRNPSVKYEDTPLDVNDTLAENIDDMQINETVLKVNYKDTQGSKRESDNNSAKTNNSNNIPPYTLIDDVIRSDKAIHDLKYDPLSIIDAQGELGERIAEIVNASRMPVSIERIPSQRHSAELVSDWLLKFPKWPCTDGKYIDNS